MPLSATELVTAAEITLESLDDVTEVAGDFSAEEIAYVSAQITLWNTTKNDLDVKMRGGSSGVDYDPERLLDKITMRVRNVFGFSLINEQLAASSSLELVEFETGVNFG